MSIWNRISTLVKSNINALISSAEDPEKILNQLIRDMRTQFLEARKQVAVAIADEKRLKRQRDQELAKAKEWETKAMTAVKAGRDDLAKQALARKNEHDTIASQFDAQWSAQKQAADQLREALGRLNDKIQEASRKKNLLIARQKRAEAQQKIQETMSGMSDSGAFDTFARMEEKVDRMEAEAEAAVELSGEIDGDGLASEFDALESSGAGTEDALAALKAQMGVAPPASPTVAITDASSEGDTEKVETTEAVEEVADASIEEELEALLNEGN